MNFRQFFVSTLVTLFALYCLGWSLVSSNPANQRLGAAFVGLLLLLLAFVYFRVIPRVEQQEDVRVKVRSIRSQAIEGEASKMVQSIESSS